LKLVINSPGVFLSKCGDRFLLKNEGMKQEYSAKKVQQIIISTASMITTDALELAVDNNIDVIFLQSNGRPFGRLWHSKMGSISTIRRYQLKLTEIKLGTELVKEWISQKMENQIEHLSKLKNNRKDDKKEIIDSAIDDLIVQVQKVKYLENKPIDEIRNTLEGHEGTAGRIYFKTLGQLIPGQYSFNGRSKNPAVDPFNCMLNYAYGILYSNVERGCILAGLDPYIGIMHTDNYNKTALVFDIIEIYRAYMDEVVFKLFSKREVKKEMFDEIEGGLWLNKDGKTALIGAVNEKFKEKIKYRGRNIEIENIIEFDCHNIANRILDEVAKCLCG